MTANISNRMRQRIYKRDGYRCALCDSTDGLQIHHIVPRGRGGCNEAWNLICLCWRCHAAAHGGLLGTQDQREQLELEMELEIVSYITEYYIEQGAIWSPFGLTWQTT